MVPDLLQRVLQYGPLVCMGYLRGIEGVAFYGPILRNHEITLGAWFVRYRV